MGNKSRKKPRQRVTGQVLTQPPRAGNWIWSGADRGYTFLNLDRVGVANAYLDTEGRVSLYLGFTESYRGQNTDPAAHRIYQDMIAIDLISHLCMVGIDISGAGEVLASRFGANIRENLETLHVLEEEHLEAFHRGEISTVAEDLRGDAGDAGGGSCVICKCTESTPCEGNDGNPCHWTRLGVLCSTCAEALEVLEGLERGLLGEELLTPAERHVLELLEAAGYDPGVAANLRREFDLVDQEHDLDRSIRRTVVREKAAAYELELGDKAAEIGGSSADRSSCPHGAAVADECKLFPRCHVCVEKPGTVWWNSKGDRYELGNDLNWRHTPEGGPLRGAVNCLECKKHDRLSCTWSNGGPAPCPGFERDTVVTEEDDRVFIRRTEGDLIEERPATKEELEHARRACTVFVGLEKIRNSAVPIKDPIKCRVGEEMGAAWCKVCPYYSEEGL